MHRKPVSRAKRALLLPLMAFLLATSATAQDSEENLGGWPKDLPTRKGLIVLYQPQLEELEGDQLKARSAFSYTAEGSDSPTFGTVWVEARVRVDRDARMVEILEVSVPRARFPEVTPELEKSLIDFLEAEIPKWNMRISLDRVLTDLEISENRREAAEGIKDDPPKILISEEPAVLVFIDGEPRLQRRDDDLQVVVNTPFLIVQYTKKKAPSYYLSAGNDTWYESAAILGPWKVTSKVPSKVEKLAPDDQETDDSAAEDVGGPPRIVVATEPSELIVIDGGAEYAPIGTDLLYVTNTESDIVVDLSDQRHYVLLSGRWYAGGGLEGPWSNVLSDELPPAFSQIPSDSEMAHLRTFVAGTIEAEEAVLDSQIPQTSAIKRDSTIEVEYDGDPVWEDIEDTELQYAANSPKQVIKFENSYYCVDDGVWYVASSAQGPWAVATEVPPEIYTQKPSSPTYNTTYVYVYDSTPSTVYVGYYPGYVHSYHHHGCMVYGTGWWYRPWYGSYYYPRPATYGFHVRYNPWYGWSVGFSWSNGPFTFSIGRGGGYYGGWFGPVGYRPYARGYNRGYYNGYRAGYRAGQNRPTPYGQNLYNRPQNQARNVPSTRPANAQRPTVANNRANNVYSDRDGNVHRRNSDGSWQTRDSGNWKADAGAATREGATRPTTPARPTTPSTRPTTPSTRPTTPSTRPTTPSTRPTTPSTRPSVQGSGSLNQSYGSRQRGSTRTNTYRGSAGRSSGGARGGRRR